jgi:hypothetical protein
LKQAATWRKAADFTTDEELAARLRQRADVLEGAEKVPVGKVVEGAPKEKPAAPAKPVPKGEATELPVEKIELDSPDIPAGEATEIPVENVMLSTFDPGRRKVVMGTAAALLSSAAKGEVTLGRAKPISEAVMNQNVDAPVAKILRGNGATNPEGSKALKQALGLIATEGPAELRPLAAKIASLLPERGLMLTVDDARLVNAHGVVELSPIPHMTLFTAKGRTGLSYDTVLHEALHAAVAARYRSISSGAVRSNDAKIGVAAPAASAEMAQFVKVWKEFREVARKEAPADKDLAQSLEQTGSPDEFFVRALTDPKLQAFMASKKYGGTTLLQRFKDWIKTTLLGLRESGTAASWLDAALTATDDLTSAMVKDAADFARLRKTNELVGRESSQKSTKFEAGVTYTDANGNKAIYQADGTWKPVK